ncbi:uncharacterized protein LOC142224514 [Haematobia irritans]|uniref:uncharacterized protein LOC142224514 n=1 Tax=Haematobia irritans TaxID=7368 RepID=UPI003F50358C
MATAPATVTVFQTSNVPEFTPSVESWQVWKEKLDIHFCEVNCVDDNAKKAILLKSIGPAAYNILHSLCSPDPPVTKAYKELCEILGVHFTPPVIVFKERKEFHLSVKSDGETVAEWYARVKRLALNCKFGDNLEAFVLNQFVVGLPETIFEKLCDEDESLTLQNALKRAMIVETRMSAKQYVSDSVNYVNRSMSAVNRSEYRSSEKKKYGPCKHCGWRNHESQFCKYKESRCYKCKAVGHLAAVCRGKRNGVNYVSNNLDNEDPDVYNFENSVFSLMSNNSNGLYYIPVTIDGINIEAVCDTGAPCIIVPISFYKNKNIFAELRPCKTPYVDYSGTQISLLGEYDASITYRGVTKTMVVVVSKCNSPALLGRSFLKMFNFDLVQVNFTREFNL